MGSLGLTGRRKWCRCPGRAARQEPDLPTHRAKLPGGPGAVETRLEGAAEIEHVDAAGVLDLAGILPWRRDGELRTTVAILVGEHRRGKTEHGGL